MPKKDTALYCVVLFASLCSSLCYTLLCHVALWYIVLCCAKLCQIWSCHVLFVILCHVMLCCVMVMTCCVALCYFVILVVETRWDDMAWCGTMFLNIPWCYMVLYVSYILSDSILCHSVPFLLSYSFVDYSSLFFLFRQRIVCYYGMV